MRRCLAIGLAVLVLTLGARGVSAQDDGQSASDRLLEILKERQIISESEYSELKGLASKMEAEDTEISRRLGELDRSISDYLSKGDDKEYNRAHVSYRKGQGFQFATADGLFELNLGGFFLFTYTGMDMGRMNYSYRYETQSPISSGSEYLSPRMDSKDYRFGDDTNNFDVQENRIHLFGHAFMKDLTYFVEFDGAGESSSVSEQLSDYPNGYIDQAGYFYSYSRGGYDHDSSVELLEAWVNYDHCGYFEVKFGQFKPPTDRNFLIHESDLAFPERCLVNDMFSLQRDVGVQIHDMREFKAADMTMAYDYSFGVFNGEGTGASYNDNNRVGYSGRATFYPLGYLPYTESDFACSEDPKVAMGFWYGSHKADIYKPQTFGERIRNTMTSWGFDATAVWQGFYVTAEYLRREVYTDQKRMYYTDGNGHERTKNSGGFVQAGYFIKDLSLEVLGRLAVTHITDDPSYDTPFYQDNSSYYSNRVWVNEVSELSLGLAYYFSGHDWKVTFDMGKVRVDFKHMKDEINDYVRLAFWLNW
ncbi:MAG: OprO/OprP family phosphate-selective porin [Planctomycetes bacterium]|jgi:hypothetical protein|nr:OprO/OprP family phosphate-selective porin [Planctomycetota bacterium]